MAKTLISRIKTAKTRSQSGFSMIELLMAAFILAIGILGIAMLQAMALRSNRGSSNMVTAARIAGRIVDQAELEGRLGWLNITDSNTENPQLLGDFRYIPAIKAEQREVEVIEVFNIYGRVPDKESSDPRESVEFFYVTTTLTPVPSSGGLGTVGKMSDLTVKIAIKDNVNPEGNPIERVFGVRRITHG